MRFCIKIGVMVLVITFLSIVPASGDEVRLQNGDRITGKVLRMEEGKLIFTTAYAGDITIQWKEISNLITDEPIRVVLSDDTKLNGATRPAEKSKMKLKMGDVVEMVSFDLSQVKSINPEPAAPKPVVKLKGRVNLGASITSGNSDTETYHGDGNLVARTEKNRYTIGAEYDRAEDNGEKTVNRTIGYLKYDHFLNEKWYFYTNAFFEKDEFKDLDLRTSIGAGAGYQFFETPITNLSAEAGLTYVNKDYELAQDNGYPAGRWSVNFDRYFLEKRIQFFHFHEGFVSIEDTDDIFIRSRTGFHFPLYKNFQATIQYNYDWDKSPAPGREKTDEMVIFSLGYAWDVDSF